MIRLIQLNKATLLFLVLLVFFGFSPVAQALLPPPPPDGSYPNQNTAEGDGALFTLTTGSGNTAIGFQALFGNTTGSYNSATGLDALLNNTTGRFNTANGTFALGGNSTASYNTAIGFEALLVNSGHGNTATGANALLFNSIGTRNTANGAHALESNQHGNSNVADGAFALSRNSIGSFNIALGFGAGLNLTTGSNNIDIGSEGRVDESNKIRIGTPSRQNGTFIAGIRGVTVADGVPVVIGSDGQLGSLTSSVRSKQAIKPMDKASEVILGLKPVTFHYKSDATGRPQFGLIAEEVAKVNPHLVVRDKNGEIYTVRYDAVNAMLLNEFLKEHRKNQEQEATIAELQATTARQQKQVEALTGGLQKVSVQLEASRPAPQVGNDP